MSDIPKTLNEWILRLKSPQPTPRPGGEETWTALMARIETPSQFHGIDESTYDYFLNVLPPRWWGHACFAFGEGADELRLFWTLPGGKDFCVRQLTVEEHFACCRLAGINPVTG